MTTNDGHAAISLVPPQLPPFLASVFNLKPILGNPSREEIKLVHEAVRAMNNFLHTPELRNTDISIELSQHLFDIQMACHRQKYPTSVLPNDVIYDPPTLPAHIPVELKSVNGPPSNEEVTSAHTALRISESFVNVPSIFDPDLHVQLSQHLFDTQLARHVERSIMKRTTPPTSAPPHHAVPHSNSGNTDANNNPITHTSSIPTPGQLAESTQATLEQSDSSNEHPRHSNPSEISELRELMIEIRDTLKSGNRILVGAQNSLARGFNSSSVHTGYYSQDVTYDLGAHSLINDQGEVPEIYDLPTFKSRGPRSEVSFATSNLTESELARYLRFYNMGEELVEEGEDLKIKPGMVDDA
ncbi:unnamed protein product [Rhizoctonia solani]|uniref:Laminin domain protein n=2 Tax=Rhizoctonia solani TaxID=456999 RepID=A0A8H3GU93_9AGAM|nr:putative laminin domain protein [Rhizoctonia solani 123E]CAE6468646.1 unnamed protein product [Rhizoctonia solani]